MERRRQVDGDDRVPFVDGEILDVRHVLDAGIVDQHVDRAELLFRLRDHRVDLGRLGHVGARIDCLDAEFLLEPGAFFLDRGSVAEAVDDQIGAVLGHGAGDGQPDAGGGAGDQRGFAFEHDGSSSCGVARSLLRDGYWGLDIAAQHIPLQKGFVSPALKIDRVGRKARFRVPENCGFSRSQPRS